MWDVVRRLSLLTASLNLSLTGSSHSVVLQRICQLAKEEGLPQVLSSGGRQRASRLQPCCVSFLFFAVPVTCKTDIFCPLVGSSALLAAQLAQAHTTPTPTPTSSPASAYQSSPLRGPSHLAAPPPTNNRTFISSGPYRPPPPPQGQTATPPNSGQLDQARNFDVFGLTSPGQPAVPQQLANVDSSVGGSTNGAQGRGGRDVPSLSPIGSEVRSFASTTTTTQQGPRRPTQPTHRSSTHLRDVLHQRQASEGLLGLNTHSTASVGSNLTKNGTVKDQ